MGPGRPGLVAKRVKSQSGGPAGLGGSRRPPRRAAPFAFGSDFGGGRRGPAALGRGRDRPPRRAGGCATPEKPINSSRHLLPSGVPGCQPAGPEGLPTHVPMPPRGDIPRILPRCCCRSRRRGPGGVCPAVPRGHAAGMGQPPGWRHLKTKGVDGSGWD